MLKKVSHKRTSNSLPTSNFKHAYRQTLTVNVILQPICLSIVRNKRDVFLLSNYLVFCAHRMSQPHSTVQLLITIITETSVLVWKVMRIDLIDRRMAPPLFSVEKNPSNYEPYTFTLSEKFRKLAQEELRENDEIREQSLTQMREWIAKHPFIRKCRTDAVFLLRFLRFKKFSVPTAQEALERYLAMRQTFCEWFKQLDPRDELMQTSIENEVFTIIGQDEAGRTVVFIRYGLFDVEKLNPIAIFRYTMMFLELLLEDEKLQIGGFRVWVDYTESLMKHYGMWGVGDLKLLMDAVNKTMPIRIREIHGAKLPKFALTLVNLLLSFASSKLKERIVCHATVLESKNFFDQSLWPKQYGGTHETTELAQKLKDQLEEKRNLILALDDMDIDIEH